MLSTGVSLFEALDVGEIRLGAGKCESGADGFELKRRLLWREGAEIGDE